MVTTYLKKCHAFSEDFRDCVENREIVLLGQCALCGFHGGVWQPVRKTLVFDSYPGKLRPDVSRVWLTRIQWDHIKTGEDDSNCEDDLRQKREGTVIEFLDETEAAFKNFTPHIYLIE
jgi:hypothetical protein